MSGTRETYTPGYSAHAVGFMSRGPAASHAAFFLPHLKSGMRLLDCGCGPGAITVGLAERVQPAAVVGVELGEEQQEQARDRAQAAKARVTFHAASVYELPFPDADFEAV